MRHRNKHRTLGRRRNQRAALLRSLARSLVLHEKIHTTEAKAKELRPFVEKLITRSKEKTVANQRVIMSRLGASEGAAKKLFMELGPRYKERAGGYTRITKLVTTSASGRKEAQIELVQ